MYYGTFEVPQNQANTGFFGISYYQTNYSSQFNIKITQPATNCNTSFCECKLEYIYGLILTVYIPKIYINIIFGKGYFGVNYVLLS